jgi:hypothetical protein
MLRLLLLLHLTNMPSRVVTIDRLAPVTADELCLDSLRRGTQRRLHSPLGGSSASLFLSLAAEV